MARPTPSIRILANQQSSGAVLYGLYEVLSGFSGSWTQVTGDSNLDADFNVEIVSLDTLPFTCVGGVPVNPHDSLAQIGNCDVLIIPDLALDPTINYQDSWDEYRPHLQRIHEQGTILASVCSGSVLLAGCGFLGQKKATTHWAFFDHFQSFFPEINLQPNRILVSEHEGEGIITTGGMSSWEDLALYLIAKFHGEAIAINTAKLFLLGDRGEGQLIFAAMNKRKRITDGIISASLEWISSHYELPNPVTEMAERSGLTTRTFKRRFKLATGYSPIEYVQALRVEEAKQLLEMSSDPIDDISHQIGYEDPTSFRRLFKRIAGVTPGRYRQRFQSIGRPKL